MGVLPCRAGGAAPARGHGRATMVSFQDELDSRAGSTAKGVAGGRSPLTRGRPFRPILSRMSPSPLPTACLFCLLFIPIFLRGPATARELHLLEQPGVRILFEAPNEPLARELIHCYPEITGELKRTFGWDLPPTISVRLVREREEFREWAESHLTVAVAIPQGNLIVMDASGRRSHPFALRNIFKHEVCHLLLHHHVLGDLLPRWLDEGIAQWVSDGAGDILMDQKRSVLNRVALKGGLTLAYEESKDFLEHLIGISGPRGVIEVLTRMKGGSPAEEALQKVYGLSLMELDNQWQRALQRRITWWTYLSYHLHDILFLLAGLMGIYGFIRIVIKKRRRMMEESGDRELRD